jgi:hypothetical protein
MNHNADLSSPVNFNGTLDGTHHIFLMYAGRMLIVHNVQCGKAHTSQKHTLFSTYTSLIPPSRKEVTPPTRALMEKRT